MLTVCAVLTVAAALCWPGRSARRRVAVGVVAGPSAGRPVGRKTSPVGLPRWRGRRAAPPDALVLELLAGVAAGLAAGLSPPAAVAGARAAVAPRLRAQDRLAAWLDRLIGDARAGEPVGATWIAMGDDLGLPVVAQVGRAWSLSEHLGSPLTDAVRSTIAAHEATGRLDRVFAAQSAGPRATVHVLTALPLLGLALMPVLGVDLRQAYSPGVLLLAVGPGVVLLLVGRAVTRRMIDRALRTPPVS